MPERSFDTDAAAKLVSHLAHPTKMTIVALLLEHGELRVGEILDLIDMKRGDINHHLGMLKRANVVNVRTRGNQGRKYYLSSADAIKLATTVVQVFSLSAC